MTMPSRQASLSRSVRPVLATGWFLLICAPAVAQAQTGHAALLVWLKSWPASLGVGLDTLSWLAGILLIFFVAVWRLLLPMRYVCSTLRVATSLLRREEKSSLDPTLRDTVDTTERMERRHRVARRPRVSLAIEQFYRDWRANLLVGIGTTRCSATGVDDYIRLSRVVPLGFSWGISRTMPGVFTMLGIFGTFVGLTQGVSSLSTQFGGANHDVGQLREGVLGLMHGMGTAFWTSILGIFLALLWIWFDRGLARAADRAIHALRLNLSGLCPSLGDEGLAKHLLEIGVEQKDSVKTLATDIATKVVEGFAQSMQQTVVPVLENFNRAVGDAQARGTEQLVEQFGNLMGERLRQQFENLATTIEQLCTWQKQSHNDMEEMLRRLRDAAEKQDEMVTNAMQAVAVFQASMGELGRIHQSLSVALEDFRTLSQEMSELRQTVETSQRGLFESIQQMQASLGETTRGLDEMARRYAETLPGVTERMEALAGATARQAEALDERLRTSMEKFREDAASGINHTFSEFDKHLSLLTKALSGTIQETEETVRQILGRMQQVSKTMDGVQTTAEALQTTAVTFTRAMEKAVAARDGQRASGGASGESRAEKPESGADR